MTYERKIDFAIKLLRNIPQDGPIEICYSTGKDSDIILELAKMAGIPYEAIYKNTTCDQPGSKQHALEMGVTIRNPQQNMLQLIEANGWPSRWARFCCKYLKEYKIYDRAVVGIRRCESTSRAKRYKEPEVCRTYPGKEKARQYLPILEWSDDDVVRFIEERGLKCHPHYYDEQGRFHVERRVGCIGCPLRTDCGKAEYKIYPTLLRARVRAFNIWFKSHPDSKTAQSYPDIYHALYLKLFCHDMDEYHTKVESPLFPEETPDVKAFLEDYFKIDLTV
jgi:3'-phosphoadenosine 5'-phosphosulfate sulfotransferase (PAPS reductase)/FAD synthetase